MIDRDTLIQKLIYSRQVIDAVLERVEPMKEIYPEWTLKELLAHLAGWDDACIESIRAHLKGQEAGTPAERGIDYYNAQSVLERKELALDRVQREYDQARQNLIQLIREMPEEKFNEPFILPWAELGTMKDLTYIFSHHELEHAKEIEAILDQQ